MIQTNIKTPISYYGGKQMMVRHILPLIPEHSNYIEPFFGGGAVFWAKTPSKVEVINDANGNVTNFYEVLKHDFEALKFQIETTLHSRLVYRNAMVIYELPQLFTPIQRAWAFWVTTNMGYSSKIGSWAFDYFGKCERKIQTKIEGFTDIYSDRLKFVSIENKDASEVIKSRDCAGAFHYVDPPYVDSNQGHYGGYTQENFNCLLKTLSECTGKFLLSSYDNRMLDDYVSKYGWYQKKISMMLSASNTKSKKKIEVLTANYKID